MGILVSLTAGGSINSSCALVDKEAQKKLNNNTKYVNGCGKRNELKVEDTKTNQDENCFPLRPKIVGIGPLHFKYSKIENP